MFALFEFILGSLAYSAGYYNGSWYIKIWKTLVCRAGF